MKKIMATETGKRPNTRRRKPTVNTKYTFEKCKEIASRCRNVKMFSDVCGQGYKIAQQNGWLNKFFKIRKALTKEECRQLAAKCKTRKEFERRFPGAYARSCKNGWLDKFIESSRHIGHYTYEECRKIASTVNTITKFSRKCPRAYETARVNGWTKKFAEEFNYLSTGDAIREARGFTSEEKIIRISKTCKTMREFRNKYPELYAMAGRRKLLSKMTWLKRVSIEDRWHSDTIYVYEFPTTHTAYVGRTGNLKRRHREHSAKWDKIAKYAASVSVPVPEPKVLHEGLKLSDGIRLESELIEQYKREGWNMLNQMRGGGLGCLAAAMSHKAVMREARKYKSLKELSAKNVRVYHILLKNNWLDQCTWLKREQVRPGHWDDYETCLAEAKKYETRGGFGKNAGGAYCAALRHGWIDSWPWLAKKTCWYRRKRSNEKKVA